MAITRLLPASVDPASSTEGSNPSTSLIVADRHTAVSRTDPQNDTGVVPDDHVWSVSVQDDGTFNFYSVPRNSSRSTAESRWQNQGAEAGRTSNDGWNPTYFNNVAAQYAFYAGISTSAQGNLVNVYA